MGSPVLRFQMTNFDPYCFRFTSKVSFYRKTPNTAFKPNRKTKLDAIPELHANCPSKASLAPKSTTHKIILFNKQKLQWLLLLPALPQIFDLTHPLIHFYKWSQALPWTFNELIWDLGTGNVLTLQLPTISPCPPTNIIQTALTTTANNIVQKHIP